VKALNKVWFYENGYIYRGGLAEETSFEVNGKAFRFKDTIVFSGTGLLIYSTLTENSILIVQGKPVEVPRPGIQLFLYRAAI